jgi:polyisoprenoid-binding protein YceI
MEEYLIVMKTPFQCALLLVFTLASVSQADTDVVIDNFDSYATAGDLQAAWVSSTASLTSTFLTDDSDGVYTNVQGKAAVFDGSLGFGAGSVNKWGGAFAIAPSPTQNVELSVDIAHDDVNTANKKLSVGLRYTGASTENILELGFWNQNVPPKQLSFRTILFPGSTNWQAFSLDESLDDMNEINSTAFHRFKATVSETSVTMSLDLFADGIDNFTGLPGVDATDVVAAAVTSNGFNDLRFGIPSGSGSSASAFIGIDNLALRLVDVVAPGGDADFNGDTFVDGSDFLTWQRSFGINDGTALQSDGDADGDGNVLASDLAVWQAQYGAQPLSAISAVPEPTGLSLGLLTLVGCLVARRRV